MSSHIIEITEYWRGDNELRRSECFLSAGDVAAYIRKEMGSGQRIDRNALSKLCLSVEHDYFSLLGQKVNSNERTDGAGPQGPKPVKGKLVAVTTNGEGLVMTEKTSRRVAGKINIRYGFILGHHAMEELARRKKQARVG